MDELRKLKNLIKNYKLEIDWRCDKLYLWVDFYALKDFSEIITSWLDDGGMDVILQAGYICVDLVQICEYFGIDPNDIKERKSK